MSTPLITSQTLRIPLPDDSLPPLFSQLTRLRQSVLLSLGTDPTSSFAMMNDFSVAMTTPNRSLPASAPLSRSTKQSLSLSSKLAKRYQTQIFLSLDLSSLPSSNMNGELDPSLSLAIEKALVGVLDPILRGEAKVNGAQ